MVIKHNLSAMFATRQTGLSRGVLQTTSERLSSGYQINRSADDAAGLAISEEMRKQIRGLNRGAKNINEGIDYCKTADGALAEMQDILQRMNELAIQAANGVNSDDDRSYISDEIDQLKDELERICTTTKYNEDYIFKTSESYSEYYNPPYTLKFSGYLDDIYIYNDSYDETTKTATYGGIAYNGVRYAWSSISSTMYNADTNTFNSGTYTLQADDGTWLTFTCTDGAEPPKVSCEFTMSASSSGISINGETIPWSEVYDESGEAIDLDYIEEKEYHFTYHGVTVCFTPEADEDFDTMVSRLSTSWTSSYRLSYEDTALYGNFSKTTVEFTSNDQVKEYLTSTTSYSSLYTIRASEQGIWLECNSTTVSGSLMTWAQLGIDNWGDQSDDIWEDKTYTYSYTQTGGNNIKFSFQLINETSMDSVIDALDGVVLDVSSVSMKTHATATTTSSSSNVLSAGITTQSINTTLAEEYGLGRDYSTTSDTFATSTISYSNGTISLVFENTIDGVTTTVSYSAASSTVESEIAASMQSSLAYLNVILARSKAGATDVTNLDLASVVGADNITGG